jgi:two-component system, OmpR family, alkaline phosphatase synthesis response regulator PhoP
MGTRILVVDDDAALADLLAYNLRNAQYEVQIAGNGREALRLAREVHPDLILLDLMLPEIDGLDVCRELRKDSPVPLIMITARGEETDRVVGLELGADDYIVKPFSMRELLARVRAVLRRSALAGAEATDRLQFPGGLQIDPEAHTAAVDRQPLALTRLEFELLALLMSHPGRTFSREHLLQTVWGYHFAGEPRAVDSTVKRLRAKLRRASPEADCIETVRGVGYRLAR